jgi:5'-nucleotidase
VTRRLLLDMDGPLADFDVHFWSRAVASGWTFDVDGPDSQTERFLTEHMPIKKERQAARDMMGAPGWFAELPVVAGAFVGTLELMEVFDVWVCTKPLDENPTCRPDKAAWLERHFPHLADRLIVAPDKSKVPADILLDDAPKVEWIPRASWRAVLFDAPFNREGQRWEGLARWTWGDPLSRLVEAG